jgi:hypothetical protein
MGSSQRRKSSTSSPQAKRFIKAARAAECSEDEAVFDKNLKRIVTTKHKPAKVEK